VYADEQLVIDARDAAGSRVKELRAEGTIMAPPHVVRAVLADVARYPAFMPYVKQAEILARDAGDVVVYQRLSFPLLGLVKDRDYVIRIHETVYADAAGQPVYRRAWRLERDWPYRGDGSAVRIPVDVGYWNLRAADAAGERTTAGYCLFTDPGGSLPGWIINQANTTGVPKVFAAVRTTAADPRYASAPKPETPALAAPAPSAGERCGSQ
jgi:polyketide cyclase/dehydrase/lipid transport protein